MVGLQGFGKSHTVSVIVSVRRCSCMHSEERGVSWASGLLVAAKPKWGAYVVTAWLAGIIANLWTKPSYRDIALRDLGLAIGALALARLATDVDARSQERSGEGHVAA